ncbi:MAG: FkbM family methyltransferase [Pyrinomonadaceae bacterium]
MTINQLFVRLIPFYRKLPGPLKAALRPVHKAYQWTQRRRSVVATVDGITYHLDLGEFIDSSIYFTGCFEPHTTAAIERLCREGMTVVDIGANIGCHTLRFAKLAGATGRVIAFEPMAWAHAKLLRNFELNDFQNVTFEKIALSDRDERKAVYFRTSWLRENKSNPVSLADEPNTFTTLDNYLEKHNIDNVSFIKLDVDGYEFKVIRGAARTLGAYHPTILIELGTLQHDSGSDGLKDMVTFLSELGYKFYDESTLEMYPDTSAVIAAIPEGATMNVILSASDLRL